MYRLKMAKASRIQPRSWPVAAGATLIQTNRPIQKAPYEENAVEANTFPRRNSHMPASNWTMPP